MTMWEIAVLLLALLVGVPLALCILMAAYAIRAGDRAR